MVGGFLDGAVAIEALHAEEVSACGHRVERLLHVKGDVVGLCCSHRCVHVGFANPVFAALCETWVLNERSHIDGVSLRSVGDVEFGEGLLVGNSSKGTLVVGHLLSIGIAVFFLCESRHLLIHLSGEVSRCTCCLIVLDHLEVVCVGFIVGIHGLNVLVGCRRCVVDIERLCHSHFDGCFDLFVVGILVGQCGVEGCEVMACQVVRSVVDVVLSLGHKVFGCIVVVDGGECGRNLGKDSLDGCCVAFEGEKAFLLTHGVDEGLDHDGEVGSCAIVEELHAREGEVVVAIVPESHVHVAVFHFDDVGGEGCPVIDRTAFPEASLPGAMGRSLFLVARGNFNPHVFELVAVAAHSHAGNAVVAVGETGDILYQSHVAPLLRPVVGAVHVGMLVNFLGNFTHF